MNAGRLGVLLFLALAAFVVAHVALVVAIARRVSYRRALAALVVPPLAPLWGSEARARGWAIAWLFSLGAYAAVAAIALVR